MSTRPQDKHLKPFGKGHDPRRNVKGRPKSFNALRELAQQIAHEDVIQAGEPLVINGRKVSVTEAILRAWASSKNPKLQQAFMEIAFGKVPAAVEMNVTSWEDEVVELLKTGRISPDDIRATFPANLARAFFARAGIAMEANASGDD